MKDVSGTIKERRTVRRFTDAPVEQEAIVSLLNEAAGLYEAEGTPHWRCLYAGDPESRDELAECMIAKVKGSTLAKLLPAKMTEFLKKQIINTPAHIIFIAEAADTQQQRDVNFAAVCSIMQNVQLLGWEQGLGMLWYTDPMILSESLYEKLVCVREKGLPEFWKSATLRRRQGPGKENRQNEAGLQSAKTAACSRAPL